MIALASSIRTLLKNNIRVDICVLIERGSDVYEAYESLGEEFDLSHTTLFCSSTCDHRLQSLFGNTVTFFRPALTPTRIYCNHPSQILNFEGPEAVNAAASLAACLTTSSITLFGIWKRF